MMRIMIYDKDNEAKQTAISYTFLYKLQCDEACIAISIIEKIAYHHMVMDIKIL